MGRRYYSRRPTEEIPEVQWGSLMDEALNAPGHLGDTYCQGYEYSFGNQLYLRSQGAREPVASYDGWKKLGRQVLKGSRGLYIIRPITVKSKYEVDEHGQPKTYTKFKPVRGAFTYSQTEGEPLPERPPREWSRDQAISTLGIKVVQYTDISLNKQGYSYDRNIAINPMAAYPLKTTWHELGHVEAGHTTTDQLEEYEQHRGLWEFEAEGTAYLGMHELGLDNEMNPAESRAYIQDWLSGETPPETSIRKVFKLTDTILKAGYVPDEATEAAINVLTAAGLLSDDD